MDIFTFELGPLATNAYLLIKDKEALVVDAPHGTWQAVNRVVKEKSAVIKALLLTHGHWDHIADAKTFEQKGVPIYIHEEDLWWLKDPMVMSFTMPPGTIIAGVQQVKLLHHGHTMGLAQITIEVRHIPGHAPGNVLFYVPSQQAAFVGDAIFLDSIGRHDLPGGDFKTLEKSIKEQIYSLPEAVTLYPGHGPITTVKQEKQSNPFVKGT